VTGFDLLDKASFALFARPFHPLETISLIGSFLLLAAAFLSLSVPMARTALIGAALLWAYYAPALISGIRNIAVHGSNYPLAMYAPPLLLAIATVYAALNAGKQSSQRTPYSEAATFLFFVAFLVGSSLAYFIAAGTSAEVSFFVPIKTLTVIMEKMPGPMTAADPKQRSLLYVGNSGKDEECIATFNSSQQLAEYIDSFGSAVPVTVALLGDPPSNATILKVGDWPARKLGPQERIFATKLNPKISGRQSNCFAE
ncbi:MAG: hypothetical protein ABI383_02480, partial [Acidobacteriaceae bacterium]